MNRTLTGGSFNLLNSRDHAVVKGEVKRLLHKHDLDFLAVQEAKEYVQELSQIKGYNYYTWRTGGRGATENGILVKDSLQADNFKGKFYGDGWKTSFGAYHVPAVQSQVRVDGWLIIRNLHLPTPSTWKNGKLEAPENRKDDLIASMKGLRNFLRFPSTRYARIAVGDWNEPPTTRGEYSPKWLEETTKSFSYTPTSRAGHGHIDWVMAKGCRITRIFKDLDIKEASDHEPVVFTVRKTR